MTWNVGVSETLCRCRSYLLPDCVYIFYLPYGFAAEALRKGVFSPGSEVCSTPDSTVGFLGDGLLLVLFSMAGGEAVREL